jgi:hypothetical protein
MVSAEFVMARTVGDFFREPLREINWTKPSGVAA